MLYCGPSNETTTVTCWAPPTSLSATVSKAFEYHGDLTETSLPEILYKIHRFQVPGVIEANLNGVIKRIYVRDGAVVHATSTDLSDSLGAHLRRGGRLSPAQYEATMRARGEGSRRYGVLLVEQNLLGPDEVYQAIREQVEAIVWSLFYWEAGQVSFRIGDFETSEHMRIQLPMRRVILAGIKRAPNAKSLVARLGKKETLFEPCFHTEELIESGLDAVDLTLLRLVDGNRSLFDVCTQGPLPPADNAKLMYAFLILQLIRRSEAQLGAPAKPDTGQIKIRLKTAGDLP